MKRRLINSALGLLILTVVVLASNQLIVSLLSRFSDKLITENHELYSLLEYKGSLDNVLIGGNEFLLDHNDFPGSIANVNAKFDSCSAVLSDIHKKEAWDQILSTMSALNTNANLLIIGEGNRGVLSHVISHQILDLIAYVDHLVDETLFEIDEFEERVNKARLHGSITVVAFGIILLLVISIGSYRFILKFTQPIEQLVATTKKIGEGNRDMRVEIDSKDEFLLLAKEFNSMLDSLNETTYSKNYLNKILNNLYGALFVTDEKAVIKSINQSSLRLLKYEEEELIGSSIMRIFNPEIVEKLNREKLLAIKDLVKQLKKETTILTKNDKSIPVYITADVLRDSKGVIEGMILVGHDLTEEKEQEEKLEKLRKERMIAVNEAQEEERLRIARDLHDGLGQLLTGISYSIQKMNKSKGISSDFAEKLHIQVNNAIQEAKNISHNLTPIVLKDFGLLAAIQNLVQRTNQLKKTKFVFKSYSFTERIDEKLEKAIYRICQETINNIIKHAAAKNASLELYRVEDMIVLVAEDDGKGFNAKNINNGEYRNGFGLMSIQERADAFNGEVIISSEEGVGTEIVVELPCRKSKNNG